MKRLLPLLALLAFALSAHAVEYWLYDPGAKTLTLSDDSGAPCTPVAVYNVSSETSGSSRLVKNGGNQIPYEGCVYGGATFDFTLPIKDAEGNAFTLVKIGDEGNGFSGFNYVGAVKTPDSLEYLGTGAFRNAKYLRSFEFPENPAGLQFVGDSVFIDCERLECLEWPSSISTMKGYVCYNTGISGVCFPAVTNIGANAFTVTPNLRSVEFGGAAGQTIVFKPQAFQNQGMTIKTILFHEATPDLADGFVNGGNNFLDHVGFNGLVVYIPMNAAKTGPSEAWSAWATNYLEAFTGKNGGSSTFSFPTKNQDGTWTDGSWYHHASYFPARKTYVVRYWDPDSATTSALLAY